MLVVTHQLEVNLLNCREFCSWITFMQSKTNIWMRDCIHRAIIASRVPLWKLTSSFLANQGQETVFDNTDI
jgi:hypothetical protein